MDRRQPTLNTGEDWSDVLTSHRVRALEKANRKARIDQMVCSFITALVLLMCLFLSGVLAGIVFKIMTSSPIGAMVIVGFGLLWGLCYKYEIADLDSLMEAIDELRRR